MIYSVAIHLLETHADVPASRSDTPKFAFPQHDHGLAGSGVLDAWPIGRAESRRQVRPGLRKKVSVNIGDWHFCLRFADHGYLGAGLPG